LNYAEFYVIIQKTFTERENYYELGFKAVSEISKGTHSALYRSGGQTYCTVPFRGYRHRLRSGEQHGYTEKELPKRRGNGRG